MEGEESCRPVPAPRRLYPELRKSEYENVTVALINKNLNINSENIHIVANCTEKVPNNKIFLNSLSDQEEVNATKKSILTETNDLYGPNANEIVPEPPISSMPTPAPRPRKPQNTDTQNANDIYENTQTATGAIASPEVQSNTGAVCKEVPNIQVLRKAPELPPKTYLNVERSEGNSAGQRYSFTSEVSTTSSVAGGGGCDLGDSNFSNTRSPKSASNVTLNSSIADSTESTENAKFKSPSPGYVDGANDARIDSEANSCEHSADSSNDSDNSNCPTASTSVNESDSNTITTTTITTSTTKIHDPTCNESDANDLLKSLGSTSKLLTESIGERVALKAKGVRNKLDKNLKTSSELLSNIGSETTSRLKNVGKHFNTNFTLNKKDKDKSKDTATAPFHNDRPQTLPPDDRVFHTISFSSPLNRQAEGTQDLSGDAPDCSYDLPRRVKLSRSDLDIAAPPSYEDALKFPTDAPFTRNVLTSKSLMVPKHLAAEAASVALSRQRANASLQNVAEEPVASSSSRDSIDLPSPPMPAFPPPALPTDIAVSESVYGRINSIQPPVRQKRRKNYEQIQLRRALDNASPVSVASLRPNVDSTELHQLNVEAANAEREESLLLREQIRKAEEKTPKPARSDSWEYYEDNADESICSSPEPLYANEEATYGKLFEMATSNTDVLAPQSALSRVSEESAVELRESEGAVGGWVRPPVEVLREFDPLSRKTLTICRTEKSNQLLLLEHLLEEDIYGSVSMDQAKSDDDISMCTSEEDNINTVQQTTTALISEEPKPLTVVVPTPNTKDSTVDKPSNNIQIVHQNAHLLSDSMENMADDDDEARVRPYLSHVDERAASNGHIDNSRNGETRTHWFVQDSKENGGRANPFDRLHIEGDCPPSYLEAIGADGRPTPTSEPKPRTSRFKSSMNVFSNVKQRVGALTRKTSFKVNKGSEVKVTLQMVPRPSLSPLLVRYEGPLIRFPSGVVEDILKDMQSRKTFLRDRQFQTYLDLEMKTPKEIIPLEYITTVQCVSNSRVTDNSTHFYCFEIATSMPKNHSNNPSATVQPMSNPNLVMTSSSSGNCKHQRVAHLYGVSRESERGVWMQKIMESLTNAIPLKYICHYYRAGWCYLKHSITSEWSGTWLVLKKSQRRLVFVSEAAGNVEKMDLRKARCIVLKDSDESIRNLHVESGPMLMIDCPPFTVYMVMSSPRETKIWRHIIREVAHNNGFSLSDQQLTKFNVPVIVDKCINFVYIHGSMSEGIYRKSGSENSIAKLLAAFRTDAFNVEITRNEYNEHDVANALKRFMRDLPERLMGKLSDSFMCVTELTKLADKIQSYKELLARLSVIERETLKKIVGHLTFISSQKTKNKMSIKNLTMIWGPTLMQNNQHQEKMVYSQKEADVLADLIVLYKNLFPLSPEEMKKEQEMLMCLQKYYASAETLSDSVKKSGDLKMWIILNPKPENSAEEKTQVNVTISPTKTVYEICKELAPKMQMATHQVSLHEVILNDSLERPLHHEIKVFDVVLNWSYWPEDDRKHNYLVVKPIDVLREVQRAVKNLATVTPSKELKFADNRTKSFKPLLCELRDGKIVISKKDKNDKTTIVREIFLHSTTAYLGIEKKRDFPWSWAITFVERTQTQILRSRDSPYIGHVLAGSEWVDRTIWFSSIWCCIYGDSILPPAEIIMK